MNFRERRKTVVSENIQFKYFYGTEADMFTFYRIPKLLVTDEYFKGISNDAKILYGLMLDRMSLSARNGWKDEENRVFIYFSIEDVMELLNVGKNKAVNVMAELDGEKGIGLIEKRKQGQGKAAIIYVKSFIREEAQEFENQTSSESKAISEVYISNFKDPENQTSRSLESKTLGVCISNPNNNKYINNNLSDTKSNPIISEDGKGKDEIRYAKIIRENLEIDFLIERNLFEAELYEGIYELVLETVMSQAEYTVISRDRFPTEFVRSRMLKLNSGHIEYAVGCLKANTSKVHNIKKYMLAVLFNAPATISSYYQAEVNHDFPQFVRNA